MIDGRTLVIPHLAYPSAHLKTPGLLNARLAERAINARVVPWEVPPAGMAAAVAGLRQVSNVAGIIVTIPHKQTAASLCDHLHGAAAMMQVVNVIRRDRDGALHGAMYDGRGFVEGLRGDGVEPRGKSVLLLGAGGAASALAHALAEAGVARLALANRDRGRAQSVVEKVGRLFPAIDIGVAPADAGGFDIVVNATSAGLSGDATLPVRPETIRSGLVVADIVMDPEVTPLLALARERGARVHFGRHMLEAQLDLFIEFLLGQSPGDCPETSRS